MVEPIQPAREHTKNLAVMRGKDRQDQIGKCKPWMPKSGNKLFFLTGDSDTIMTNSIPFPPGAYTTGNTPLQFFWLNELWARFLSLTAGSKAPYYTAIFHVKLKQQNKFLITIWLMENCCTWITGVWELRCGCNGKFSACEWLQIHSFGNPVPYKSQRRQRSDELLPHAVKKKSWRTQESVVNSPSLTLSKEKKKVLISWDTSWHSLDYRSSVTSTR